MDAEQAETAFESPLEALPYRAALESIREEFEPRERRSLTERGSAIVASATEFLGKRQVVAASVVIVIALLVTVVATGARGWGEIDPTPTPETELSSTGLAAVVAPTGPAVATADPTILFGSAAANVGSKTTEQRSHVTDDRNASKKVTPQKAEPQKKITIPKFSTALMSQVDSVAARAATSSRPTEAITFQPLPSPLGSGRTNFGYNEPSSAIAPQRAKLVGEMPSPRVPPEAVDLGGTVRVRFTVDTEGRPVMSTLAVETSPSPLLTAAVRSTIAGIRFDPARTGGADSRAVTDVVRVGFQFVPRNR
jgi:TonB family protein